MLCLCMHAGIVCGGVLPNITCVCVCVQMDLRDQETAAAVQDLEVRQMELEAQRKLLEQVDQPGEHCSCTAPSIQLLNAKLSTFRSEGEKHSL